MSNRWVTTCVWCWATTICICWPYTPGSAVISRRSHYPLLEAPDADELLNWLRRQPLLQIDEEKKLVMAHAGITPQWDLETAKTCARDAEAVLASDSYPFFLDAMYGDMPNNWVMTSAAWHDCVLSPMLLRGCATASRTGNWICIAKIRRKMRLRRLSHGLPFLGP